MSGNCGIHLTLLTGASSKVIPGTQSDDVQRNLCKTGDGNYG